MLLQEHEQDLENYQKLLKEYSTLEQRNEHLENLVEKLMSGHSRSPSDVGSLTSSHTSAEMENDVNKMTKQFCPPGGLMSLKSFKVFFTQDFGYSSNKSTISRREETESSERDDSLVEVTTRRMHGVGDYPEVDIGLVLKLQQKLKDVEKERDKLFLKVESLEKEESPSEERQRTVDTIRVNILLLTLDPEDKNMVCLLEMEWCMA